MKRIDWRLVGILSLGFSLRCICLSTRSINYDDAFSFFLARQNLGAIIQGTAADTMPPLYYFLLHFWLQFSESIGWLRLLSILLNLGAVVFLYLLVRQIFSKSAGWWAAFFAAISPLQIYHAQDLRMYALLAFTQLGYLYFFYIWWSKHFNDLTNWKNWLPLILLGCAAMYTHNLAVFALVIPDLFLIARREWRALLRLLFAQGIIGLLTLPWLMLIPGQVEKIQRAFSTPTPGLTEVLQAIIVMTTNLPLEPNWLTVGAILSLQIFLLLVIEQARQSKTRNSFLLSAFLIPPVALFLASYLMRPVFVPRGFITSTLIYLGIAGGVVGLTQNKVLKWLLGGGFVLAALIGLPYQLTYEQFPRSPFAQAMEVISQSIQPGEKVIHDNKLSYFPVHYYAPELDQSFIADEPGSPNDTYAVASQAAIGLIPQKSLEAAVGNADSLIFVVFQKTIDEYLEMGASDHPSLAWLKSRFLEMKVVSVGDLRLYHFSGRK